MLDQRLPLCTDAHPEERTQCRICGSQIIAYVRDIPMRRQHKTIPLYICLICDSLFHPQYYEEDDAQRQKDAEWHVEHEERNAGWGLNLVRALQSNFGTKSAIEIGCGTGTVLNVCMSEGWSVKGFDTNEYAAVIGKDRHGIEILTDLWRRDTIRERFDIVLLISVLEHLPEPRKLIEEIALYCKKHNSLAFVAVPFVTEREDLHFLLEETPTDLKNPFYLCDVHINHFSRRGFEIMCSDAGMTATPFNHGWNGYVLQCVQDFGNSSEELYLDKRAIRHDLKQNVPASGRLQLELKSDAPDNQSYDNSDHTPPMPLRFGNLTIYEKADGYVFSINIAGLGANYYKMPCDTRQWNQLIFDWSPHRTQISINGTVTYCLDGRLMEAGDNITLGVGVKARYFKGWVRNAILMGTSAFSQLHLVLTDVDSR